MYKVQKKLSADRMYYEDIKCEELFTVSINAHNHSDTYIGRDKDGNFYDTIVASGGYAESFYMGANGDEELLWQMAVPLQTVTRNDGKTEKFMLLSSSLSPTAENCGYASGGLPSGRTTDGLWPLTNAINLSKQYGASMELIASKDADNYCHYLFGSS